MVKQHTGEANWTLVIAVVGVVAVVALILGLVAWDLWMAPQVAMDNKEAGEEIADRQIDADVAMQDYRWFRQQWHDIQAQQERTKNLEEKKNQFFELYGNDTNEWTEDTRTRHSRIQDHYIASKSQTQDMIEDYNARANDPTRAMYKCGLPFKVDEKLFISSGITPDSVEYTSQEAANENPPEDPSECKYVNAPEN